MSDVLVPETAPLSQPARLVDTFIAPAKTFNDIRRDASWWLPFLLVSLVALVFSYVILHKVGLSTLVDNIIHQSSMLEERMSSASPGDAARIRAGMEMQFKFMYVSPVIIAIAGLLISGLFLATANFGFGGKARYGQMIAVWFYGTLPLLFISLITIATVSAGMASDSFNIKNAVGTNIGYFLQDGSSPKWLVTLLTSFDIFAIWAALLLTLGVSIVAGIKRSSAAIVVFGWWALYVFGQTALAAITG